MNPGEFSCETGYNGMAAKFIHKTISMLYYRRRRDSNCFEKGVRQIAFLVKANTLKLVRVRRALQKFVVGLNVVPKRFACTF